MKLKKTVLNQAIIKKNLKLNPIVIIFCLSDFILSLDYKLKKICNKTLNYPNFLFNDNYVSKVQKFLLSTRISYFITFFKVNYKKLKVYGFSSIHYNFFSFKEVLTTHLYFFEPVRYVNLLKTFISQL